MKQKLLNTIGEFSWNFGNKFFVETPGANYVWSDPDYSGDNTFTLYNGSYTDWLKVEGLEFARDKGKHIIGNYCGNDIVIK